MVTIRATFFNKSNTIYYPQCVFLRDRLVLKHCFLKENIGQITLLSNGDVSCFIEGNNPVSEAWGGVVVKVLRY